MRERGFLATVLLACVLFAPSTALAGPWTPEPGHGFAKLWTKWLLGHGYVDGNGNRTNYGNYHEFFVATYGDIGIVDGLAAFWHTDLLRVFTLQDPRTGERQAHVAPGDPALGLRWRFLQVDRFVMSVEGSVRAPLARSRPVQNVYARSDPHEQLGELRVGAGVWNVDGRLSLGYGFDRVYLAASGGYQWRGEGFDDRITWSAEVGGNFTDRWGGRARASGAHSLDEDGAPRGNSPSGIGNGVSWAGFALEVDYRLRDGWYLGLTLEGGLSGLRRQTGGPVTSLWVATQY
ncbi:MAG: hypothetical protein AAGE52_15425 [Myxococcota bacterium]